ncbi:hypothetical protein FHU14_004800 [Mesorhizobium sp. RMAD-H1]|nr:hypothetical protein [Mesorhizobium sp. RMAD-H1]
MQASNFKFILFSPSSGEIGINASFYAREQQFLRVTSLFFGKHQSAAVRQIIGNL